VIGVTDVTRAAVRIGASTYQPVPPFTVALLIYLAIIGALVLAQRLFEGRQLAGNAA
jgi:ABC-type amino acid transport system permease subunit